MDVFRDFHISLDALDHDSVHPSLKVFFGRQNKQLQLRTSLSEFHVQPDRQVSGDGRSLVKNDQEVAEKVVMPKVHHH
jgi:hypothetical protein